MVSQKLDDSFSEDEISECAEYLFLVLYLYVFDHASVATTITDSIEV